MARLRPLGDSIVAKLIEENKVTKGGLIIPDTAFYDSKTNFLARILAVGPGKWDVKHLNRATIDLEVGDIVVCKKYTGWRVFVEDEELAVFTPDDVAGVIEEKGVNDPRQTAIDEFVSRVLDGDVNWRVLTWPRGIEESIEALIGFASK